VSKGAILMRLNGAHPGWCEWDALISLVESLDFEVIIDKYLGEFYVSTTRLSFAKPSVRKKAMACLPPFVWALYGMKADFWQMAGGYADSFNGDLARVGAVFSPAGNDDKLGLPVIWPPRDTYYFQSNSGGALFFVNKKLDICYPSTDGECFETLDTLDEFTKTNIRQVLDWKQWFRAYSGRIKGTLLD
jgi:hypothetical protein